MGGFEKLFRMGSSRRRVLRLGAGAVTGVGGVAVAGRQYFPNGGDGEGSDTVKALVAGSLVSVATDVPGATVEAHGSLVVRQLLADDARDPDVVAMADPALFAGIADRTTLFASNALVLAYHPESTHADAFEADWADALTREGVRVGRTDPAADPLGYRTVLALRLADRRGIADASTADRATVLPETSLGRNLELGELDAAFVYESMAVEHGVPFVDLPSVIDFSDPERAETYASVSLELAERTVRGAPIRYGATALTDRGGAWFKDAVGGTRRLREHGFTVPDDYPRRQRVTD